MSMHTTQEWHQHASSNMTQAKAAHLKAARQCHQSRGAHAETVSDNISMYNEVSMHLQHKVANSHRLIEKQQMRADSIEKSIALTKESMAALEEALLAKDAPLNLCQWRMEQRERRPLREQVRDVVEVTLESEKVCLIDTQNKLKASIKRTKASIQDLNAQLEQVRQDIDQKLQAVSVDEMCLRTTQRSFQTVLERSPPHRIPGSSRLPTASKSVGPQVALGESNKNEVNRQQEAIRLNQSAGRREESAKMVREENAAIVARCRRAQEAATAKSEGAMKARVNENQQMRKRLETEIRETHTRIDETKRTVQDTRYQMKALEEPMQLTNACSSWRKNRPTTEHINDPVSTKLSEHQHTLIRAHQDLSQNHSAEKTFLQDLHDKRERLMEDLRDKTSSLHIDLNCLTHEASHVNGRSQTYMSKNKLTRAMKVDPMFVPVPGLSTAMMKQGLPEMPMTAR